MGKGKEKKFHARCRVWNRDDALRRDILTFIDVGNRNQAVITAITKSLNRHYLLARVVRRVVVEPTNIAHRNQHYRYLHTREPSVSHDDSIAL